MKDVIFVITQDPGMEVQLRHLDWEGMVAYAKDLMTNNENLSVSAYLTPRLSSVAYCPLLLTLDNKRSF